jgi:hypothetical protein
MFNLTHRKTGRTDVFKESVKSISSFFFNTTTITLPLEKERPHYSSAKPILYRLEIANEKQESGYNSNITTTIRHKTKHSNQEITKEEKSIYEACLKKILRSLREKPRFSKSRTLQSNCKQINSIKTIHQTKCRRRENNHISISKD